MRVNSSSVGLTSLKKNFKEEKPQTKIKTQCGKQT